MWRGLVCSLGLLFAQDDVVFRTKVELIRVDVEVRDGDKPVLGLKREDFLVLDNGQEQPLVEFGNSDQELDLLLVLDFSSSMRRMVYQVKQQAGEALTKLQFRDRVGVLIFDNQPYLVIPPTWDWAAVDKEIQNILVNGKGTELNQSTLMSADYLRSVARPNARRGLIMLTDNLGFKAIPDNKVRDGLWESEVVLSAVIFPKKTLPPPNYKADIKPFVEATGGDVLYLESDDFSLATVIERMRQRYGLMYNAPKRKPGQICRIQVRMRDPAKRHYRIRARTGYIAGTPGSDIRHKLSLR
jgi:VWFA-related protein